MNYKGEYLLNFYKGDITRKVKNEIIVLERRQQDKNIKIKEQNNIG